MDLWFVLLFVTGLMGILGWPIASLFVNCVLWACNLNDGDSVNWGSEVSWMFFYPFAVTFSIMEILLLYCD